MRSFKCTLIGTLLAISSFGGFAGCGNDTSSTVTASGNAFAFALPGEPYGRIVGATVSVLEMPELSTTTEADGFFLIEGLPVGADATFVLEAEGFPKAHTKTFRVPDSPLQRVTFQIPPDDIFGALEVIAGVETDPERCHLVSTVTVVGRSIYDPGAHGEEGALVSSDPPIGLESGPIYFNENVLPDRSVSATSNDGGVLFTNVPPGDYTLTATKPGVEIEAVRLKCRPGILVNASPPYGLQTLAP